MKQAYLILFFTFFTAFSYSQNDDCYVFNYEEKSLCPQCGEGEIKHDAYRGKGSTYISECKDGVLHGKWVIQSDDIHGNIITNQIGLFINGEKAGKWITSYYPSYGDELQVSEYGRTELQYKNGILEGPCKIYDRFHLKYDGQFKNGQRFGDWKLYDAKEDFEGEWSILKTPVVQIGIAKHEVTGDSCSKETVYHYISNSKDNMHLVKIAYYKGNLLHGASTEFHESGSISSVEIYKYGELNGRSYTPTQWGYDKYH